MTPLVIALLCLIVWMNITTYYALVPEDAFHQWKKVMKIQFFIILLFTIFFAEQCLSQEYFPVDPKVADFFSPNGDGHNDFFIIENVKEFPINKLLVFNRWGEVLFTSEPYNNEWDGTVNIEHPLMGTALPEGMYFYRFEFLVGDFMATFSGKIILKR